MGTDKRDRQKAAKAARIEAERKAEARQRQLRNLRNLALLVVGVVVLLFVMSALTSCGSSDSPSPSDPSEAPYGSGACPAASGSSKRTIQFKDAPKRCIDPAKHYTATIETSTGSATVELDTKKTPLTTNNFVVLARYHFFDGTKLFRTEADSGIIQGGAARTNDNADPGPGYTIADEGLPFRPKDYSAGALAMARTAAPNSASAQFFLLANANGRFLGDPSIGEAAGSYAVFGHTTKGLDVLAKIANLDDGRGKPRTTVTIKKVTITES